MKVRKEVKDYGESRKIKKKTIVLIDSLDSSDIPFNAKLFKLLEELRIFRKGIKGQWKEEV